MTLLKYSVMFTALSFTVQTHCSVQFAVVYYRQQRQSHATSGCENSRVNQELAKSRSFYFLIIIPRINLSSTIKGFGNSTRTTGMHAMLLQFMISCFSYCPVDCLNFLINLQLLFSPTFLVY